MHNLHYSAITMTIVFNVEKTLFQAGALSNERANVLLSGRAEEVNNFCQ